MRPAEAEARLARALARAGAGGEPSSDRELHEAPTPPVGPLRPAAVLLAVDLSDRPARILLTRRAAHLRHHPGQIALPGGRTDPGEDAVTCALREASEEVGLPAGAAEVLGLLPAHETVTGFAVTPVLAVLRTGFVPRPQAGEVEEVFAIPLAHCADPGRYRLEGRIWQGRLRRYWVLPWGPHYVWGATARILRGLALGMQP